MANTEFRVGRTYQTRSVGDHDCIVTVTITARTRCYVQVESGARFRVRLIEHNYIESATGLPDKCSNFTEHINPWGRYSMAPVIGADQELSPSF